MRKQKAEAARRAREGASKAEQEKSRLLQVKEQARQAYAEALMLDKLIFTIQRHAEDANDRPLQDAEGGGGGTGLLMGGAAGALLEEGQTVEVERRINTGGPLLEGGAAKIIKVHLAQQLFPLTEVSKYYTYDLFNPFVFPKMTLGDQKC